jgi:hypothetical protein
VRDAVVFRRAIDLVRLQFGSALGTPSCSAPWTVEAQLTELDDGDLKFHTDFRAPYAILLEKWFELPSEARPGLYQA